MSVLWKPYMPLSRFSKRGTSQYKQPVLKEPVAHIWWKRKRRCEDVPVVSFSLCCLVGGSSVSHGVAWLMGVWPHLTPGANRRLWVWVSPGERPDACGQNTRRWEDMTEWLLSTVNLLALSQYGHLAMCSLRCTTMKTVGWYNDEKF